jgi:DNA-binding response OmpR family regulator
MPKNIVLVVDDEPIVVRACCIAIAEAGFRPVIAENGAAGLETFIRVRDDVCLVLSDVVMPGLNGVEMAQQILAIEPTVKILLMSGYSDEIIKLQGNTELPVIRKPFLGSDLTRRVKSLLGLSDATAYSP